MISYVYSACMMVLLSALYDMRVSRSCTSQVWALESVNTSHTTRNFGGLSIYSLIVSSFQESFCPKHQQPKKKQVPMTPPCRSQKATFTHFSWLWKKTTNWQHDFFTPPHHFGDLKVHSHAEWNLPHICEAICDLFKASQQRGREEVTWGNLYF